MGDFKIEDGVLIKYCGHDQDVIVPEGIIAIGEGAFKDNKSIKSIKLPDSLTEIGSFAFSSCYMLTLSKKELPQSLINIGEEAFTNCKCLTELVFPSKLESIGARAFFRCESLKKIKLSKSIKFIGFAAFDYTKIKDIFYAGTLEEFGAIKTSDPIGGMLLPFSDSSSSSSTIFGMHAPTLHCRDVKDSLYHLLNKIQGLLEDCDGCQ